MISLDQILVLEQKVENAVVKIQQLNAENAALRRKCAELTNALTAKTEQFSNFEADQKMIEDGILKALQKLSTVENAVHTQINSANQTKDNSTVKNKNPLVEQQLVAQKINSEFSENSKKNNFENNQLNIENEQPQVSENINATPIQNTVNQETSPVDFAIPENQEFESQNKTEQSEQTIENDDQQLFPLF